MNENGRIFILFYYFLATSETISTIHWHGYSGHDTYPEDGRETF